MSPAASRFFAVAKRLHPDISPSLLRRVAEEFGRRYPDKIDPEPGHVTGAVIAHLRHNRTDYENRWRKDMGNYQQVKLEGNWAATKVLERFRKKPMRSPLKSTPPHKSPPKSPHKSPIKSTTPAMEFLGKAMDEATSASRQGGEERKQNPVPQTAKKHPETPAFNFKPKTPKIPSSFTS